MQEILDRANVGRSTFHTHYRDKDELRLKKFDSLRNQRKVAQEAAPAVSGKSYERIIGFSQAMFEHAQEYRPMYSALIRSQAGPIVRQRVHKLIADRIREKFRKESAKRKKTESMNTLYRSLVLPVFASNFS